MVKIVQLQLTLNIYFYFNDLTGRVYENSLNHTDFFRLNQFANGIWRGAYVSSNTRARNWFQRKGPVRSLV